RPRPARRTFKSSERLGARFRGVLRQFAASRARRRARQQTMSSPRPMGSTRGKSKPGPHKGDRAALRGPILIGLGANLPSPAHGPPQATLEAALAALRDRGLGIRARSRWWESAPVPPSDQPWYLNGVIEVETRLAPGPLLALLHQVEAGFGRV